MKVLKREDWVFMQPITLTYPVDHAVLETRVKVQRLDSCRVMDKRIKVEILNIHNNNRRAQSQMAWVKPP